MKIGLSLEATQVLRNTWHSAINHEWYEFLHEHTVYPLVCHAQYTVTDYDVIVLCGGNDMPGIKTWRDNHYPQRDIFERQLIESALEHGIPVVGICRGSHFINVAMGGTVRLMDTPYDNVKVQLPDLEVTCHHTIQIDRLAPGFDVLLQDSTGVIELAVNKHTRQLQVGWHPERAINTHTRSMILDLIGTL
jgi:putative glutamine amidotransferase